jgi:hypothetical protein
MEEGIGGVNFIELWDAERFWAAAGLLQSSIKLRIACRDICRDSPRGSSFSLLSQSQLKLVVSRMSILWNTDIKPCGTLNFESLMTRIIYIVG